MQTHTLGRKYLSKIITNISIIFINLIAQSLILRELGIRSFGDFTFLTNFFIRIISLFNIGLTVKFYTKLSQGKDEKNLACIYFYYTVLVSALLFSFVLFNQFNGSIAIFFPGQTLQFIYLATIYAIIMHFSQTITSMGDSLGYTVSMEKNKLFNKVASLCLIVGMYYLDILNLTTYFYYHYVIQGLLIVVSYWVMRPTLKKWYTTLNWSTTIKYVREFYLFSKPIYLISILSVFAIAFDIWFLQKVSGSVQQGYYGLALRISSTCVLFTAAMRPLLLREFAIAVEQNNYEKIAVLFRRYVPVLLFLIAYIACFVSVQADRVILFLGGEAYSEAIWIVVLMLLVPIQSSYDQVITSVYHSTESMGLLRNIEIPFLIIGPSLTFFLIASEDNFGMNYGAFGLILKMVIIQFLRIYMKIYFIRKATPITFWYYLQHQLRTIVVLVGVTYMVRSIIDTLIISSSLVHQVGGFITEGFIYTIIIGLLVFFLPAIVGLQKEDIDKYIIQKFKFLSNP
jgi:O-antigen/teichoic acid export membrane protein